MQNNLISRFYFSVTNQVDEGLLSWQLWDIVQVTTNNILRSAIVGKNTTVTIRAEGLARSLAMMSFRLWNFKGSILVAFLIAPSVQEPLQDEFVPDFIA